MQKFIRLTLQDRETIQRMLREERTQVQIAIFLGRSQGSISKEISRNSGPRGYFAKSAHKKAEERKESKTARAKVIVGKVKERVIELFGERMSPKMISSELAKEGMEGSHETIYQFVKEQIEAKAVTFTSY